MVFDLISLAPAGAALAAATFALLAVDRDPYLIDLHPLGSHVTNMGIVISYARRLACRVGRGPVS
jgi:hypothetical protein